MSYTDSFANSRIDEDLALVAEVGLSVDEVEVSAEGYTRQESPSWSPASGRQAVNTSPLVFTITGDAGIPNFIPLFQADGSKIGYARITSPVSFDATTMTIPVGGLVYSLENSDNSPAT